MSRGHDVPESVRRAVVGRRSIVIRTAEGDDRGAVARLVQLADRPAPAAPLLLAEADGRLVAIVSTRSGETVADPFVATADVIELLRLRSEQLDSAA